MVRIGLFGLGTVGRGLIEIIRASGLPIEVTGVVDRSYQKKKEILGEIPASDDPAFLLKNPDIDLVVEAIGGVDLPLFILRESLDAGKNVITANKFLLAEHGYPLFSKAAQKGLKIGFEAAVAGAIPIIRNIENIFQYEQINLLEGILNGTTNYILTMMRRKKQDYAEALKKAQELGLAEADPTLDVNGMDAAHKLALLGSWLSGQWVDYRSIFVRGIEKIRLNDFIWTEKMGYRIRQISRYSKVGDDIYLTVEPSIISSDHYLWDIEMENNAVYFRGQFSGDHLFMGKGAGSLPTAYSLMSDIMHYCQGNFLPGVGAPKEKNREWHHAHPCQIDQRKSAFYMRLVLKDEPGVLAKLSSLLGEKNISIANVHQDSVPGNTGADVDLIIVTHACSRTDLLEAIANIEKLDQLVQDILFLPIDEGDKSDPK